MAKNRGKRSALVEILFWVILLGLAALVLYLVHREHGKPYNYQDTMPIMLPAVAFVLLLTAVLRYVPKEKGPRTAGILAALVLGIAIGLVALNGFYGDHPFIIEAYYGKNLELLPPSEISEVTGRLCEASGRENRDVSLESYLAWHQNLNQRSLINAQYYRGARDGVPQLGDAIALRITYQDGRERTLRLSADERWAYIEEPGVGAWRAPVGDTNDYERWRGFYVQTEFVNAFSAPIEAGETPKLPEDYNGGGKAVWIDWSKERLEQLTMECSWQAPVDRDTPEGYVPERAADVRWVFLKERTGHVYQGYWYDTRTGKRLSDSYANTYRVMVYDLLTGETKSMTDEMDGNHSISDCMKAYFGLSAE